MGRRGSQRMNFAGPTIYSINPEHDQLTNNISSLFDARGIAYQVKHSEEGYSSVHLIVALDKTVSLKLGKEGMSHQLCCEIQIRTVFEDAWGEIDHKYGYTVRSGKDKGKLTKNFDAIKKHLTVLKQVTDACSSYADAIYHDAKNGEPHETPSSSGKTIPVGADDDVLQRFKEEGIPQSLISEYVAGRDARDKALALRKKEPDISKELLIKAADIFHETDNNAEHQLADCPEKYRLISYYNKMNEAFCLLSSGDSDELKTSLGIYTEVGNNYPDRPLVNLRLGQVYNRLANYKAAVSEYNNAKQKLSILEQDGRAGTSDILPHHDYEHILAMLPKLLGFQYWALAEQENSSDIQGKDRAISFLITAIDETEVGLDKAPDNIGIINNLAYYCAQVLTLGCPKESHEKIRDILATCMQKLEASVAQDEIPEIEHLDTLLYAFQAMGENEKATV
jgi:hypothetical protein